MRIIAALAVGVTNGLLGCSPAPPASAPVATSTSATPTISPTRDPGPGRILSTALAGLAAASTFESSVTVDGAVATALAGRSVGNASELTVTTQERTVEYIRIPPTAWAREPGATWLVIDAAQAPDSPLAALANPSSLALVAGVGPASLLATYPAAVLGLAGDPVTVQITIEENRVTFRHEQVSAGHQVVSTTIFRPAANPSPIATPQL